MINIKTTRKSLEGKRKGKERGRKRKIKFKKIYKTQINSLIEEKNRIPQTEIKDTKKMGHKKNLKS